MNSKVKLLIVAVVLAVVLGRFFVVSEEEKIINRLGELRVLGEILEEEHPIEKAGKSKDISEFFTEPVWLLFENAGYSDFEIKTRKEITQKALAARTHLSRLELQLEDPKVEIKDDTAKVELTGSALGTFHSAENKFFDRHRIEVYLAKVDGDWLIEKVIHLENLRGTGE